MSRDSEWDTLGQMAEQAGLGVESMTPMKIIRDSREQAPLTFTGYPVEVAVGALEAGDYSLAGFERRVAVERKELGDLVGCLSGERARFEKELARLRGYDAAVVVVESPAGDLRAGRYRSKLDAGAAWGCAEGW